MGTGGIAIATNPSGQLLTKSSVNGRSAILPTSKLPVVVRDPQGNVGANGGGFSTSALTSMQKIPTTA